MSAPGVLTMSERAGAKTPGVRWRNCGDAELVGPRTTAKWLDPQQPRSPAAPAAPCPAAS
jgi:hypothetical protein